MKVLLVDDSHIMRRIMSNALKTIGVEETVEAANGQEAINCVSSDPSIGLVLMDWNMPQMTGIEALKHIRASGSKVPIVMVTTEAEKSKVLEAIKAGANDYLAKPFSPKIAQAKLQKYCEAASA